MGGQDGNCGGNQVTIDRDFYIGVYPVTQEEWQKVMGANPSHFRKGGAGADKLSGVSDADLNRFPVESVSWNDCQVFIKKLNESQKETGWMYRLPREAEWEYACRARPTRRPCAAGTSGLWLDPEALVSDDCTTLLDVLQRGLDSPEHAVFKAHLQRAKGEPVH